MHSRVLVCVSRCLVSLLLAVGLAGCRADSERDTTPLPGAVRSALFANGDFEADGIGDVPTGWTIEKLLNTGLTQSHPQTMANLNLGNGGYFATHVVGGAAESQTDPNLGAAASLRFPKYGVHAAVVNFAGPSATDITQNGANGNANRLSQTMTVTNADVDPADNKVHVRFAIAPVLYYTSAHAYELQPYYYVELDNITAGRTATLYQDFNISAQPGVPWKTVPDGGGMGLSYYYTDWSLVDIAPGDAGLAVGDQVKLIVIGSGCGQMGHFGRVYVDGIGSTIPGIYASATGPTAANAGSDITYAVSYKNGGTATAIASTLNLVIPDGTTFKSDSLPGACTNPGVGNTGTVTCSLGDLAAGASGSFTVTVNINAVTTGIVTNGNYAIQSTGVSALLGPKVLTTVTSGVTYADVSITKTDGVAAVGFGQAISYAVVVSNAGPSAATSVTVTDAIPAQLTGATWTCTATTGATCTASGSGSLNTTASLPVGGSATYTISANVVTGTETGTIVNTATATVGGSATDPSTSNNTAVDTDAIGVLRTLTLTKTNGNGGTITSVPASISCGPNCSGSSGSFVDGTQLVLSASPLSGASFTGWGGACASAGSTPTCNITITADISVTAAFTPPPRVNVTGGNNQSTGVSTAFPTALTVTVLDSNSNPISGATVIFTAPSTGASATFTGSSSVTTNASGVASISVTANATPGAYAITAALSGTPISGTFTLSNFGTPSSLTVVSGGGQSATVGTLFSLPLVVVVRDVANQPVTGATVVFGAPGSGPSATLTTPATTNSNGQTLVIPTANTAAGGPYLVTASTAGVTATVGFSLANTVGSPAAVSVASGGTQSATVGAAFGAALTVTVVDAYGNPVPGVAVSFAAPSSGATALVPTTPPTTNSSGQVVVSATAGTVAGSYTVTASVSGVGAGATFSLTNTAGAAFTIAAVSGGGQSTVTGAAFTAPLVARVVDQYGNAVAGVPIVFSGPSSGASSTPATAMATSDVAGLAGVNVTANGTAGSYAITAAVAFVFTPASFAMTNLAVVAISPASATVAPNGTASFSASGGSTTGYTFTLQSNGSGGSIDMLSGAYQAGGTANSSDVILVTDSLGNTATATVVIGSGVTITPPLSTVPPQAFITFEVSGGTGGNYSFSITTNLSNGSIDARGRYHAGATGGVTDTVRVVDPLGNVAFATVHVSGGLAISPTSTSSPPLGTLTFAASGGSGLGIVYQLATNASHGSIDMMTGAYRAGVNPSVTDVVSATDGLGNVATATIQVGVGVSIAPATPAIAPLQSIHFVASGGSGLGFTFAITTNASLGTIVTATGVYTAGATGGVADVVTATDSFGNTATVSISVGDGLSVSPPTSNVTPGQTQVFTVIGGSGGGYHFALLTNNSLGRIDPTTGAYTAGIVGDVTDTVQVTDSLGNQGQATVTVGPALSLAPATATVAPVGKQTFLVSGGSGAGITFSLAPSNSGGTIDPITGAYQAGSVGGVVDVVRAVDSLGNVATVQVTVTPSLKATPNIYSLPPRTALTFPISGGAGGVTFAIVVNGSGGIINASTGGYVAGPLGNTTDVVRVADVNGAFATITILVGPGVSVNPASVGIAPLASLTFVATGGGDGGYIFTLTVNASGASINPGTGRYTAGTIADKQDEVTATDTLGNTGTAQITVGNGLVVHPGAPTVPPHGTIAFTVTGGSGTGYHFSLAGNNHSGGTVDPDTGVYHAGSADDVTDEVTITDSLGNTIIVTVTVGDGISISPPVAALPPLGTLQFTVRGGSGNGVRFTLAPGGSGGDVDPDTGAYQAGATQNTDDQVTVTDDVGNSATAIVHVGAGLILNPPTASVAPNGTLVFIASGGGGAYTFVVRSNGSGATITSTSGHYTAGARADTHDVIEVTDGLGNIANASVTVGGALHLLPASPQTASGGGLTFTASGGSGTGFTYALTMSSSGGTINPLTGVYTAGPTTGVVDTVTVTDSNGNTDSVNIAIGNGLAINPGAPQLAPRQGVTFVAVGGSGPDYAFSIGTNTSGGIIAAATGQYQAGVTGNVTDIVLVTDAQLREASAQANIGPGLTITPALSTVAPGSMIRFLITGGSGNGVTFALTANPSAGAVDVAAGNYQAGLIANVTDVVTATDSLGNQDLAMINIGPALSLTPATSTVPPRGTVQLVAADGAGGYAFTLSQSRSGGTVNHDAGLYKAGKTPNTEDQVTVTDANDVTRVATISVGPGVSITPASPTVTSLATVQLAATGGSGTGFAWKLLENRSGGSIDATTGKYTAGGVAKGARLIDTVEATDSLGNSATAPIEVSGAVRFTLGGGGCDCSLSPAPGPIGWLALAGIVGLAGAIAIRRRRWR